MRASIVAGPLLVLLLHAEPGAATELRIRARDAQGNMVRLSEVEVLLVAWGDTRRIPLDCSAGDVVFPLDRDWLQSRWPERARDLEEAHLLLKAEGYAAVKSAGFPWIGRSVSDLRPVDAATISFPNGAHVSVPEGQASELTVVFRRPAQKSLRLLDEDGRPVPGVKVSSFMFWSARNHCGVLSGADPLGQAASDGQGRASIPDGDFEYALEFDKPHYVLKEGAHLPSYPRRLVTLLPPGETVVRLHERLRRPLAAVITEGGKPAAGKELLGYGADCPCGACSGTLAISDHQGRIAVEDFYPEEYSRLYLLDASGQVIWQSGPGDRPTQIQLNKADKK